MKYTILRKIQITPGLVLDKSYQVSPKREPLARYTQTFLTHKRDDNNLPDGIFTKVRRYKND